MQKTKIPRKELFNTLKDTIYQILAESDKNCKTSSNFRRKKITSFFGHFRGKFGHKMAIYSPNIGNSQILIGYLVVNQ